MKVIQEYNVTAALQSVRDLQHYARYRADEARLNIVDAGFFEGKTLLNGFVRVPEIKEQEEAFVWEEMEYIKTTKFQVVILLECVSDESCETVLKTWGSPKFLLNDVPSADIQIFPIQSDARSEGIQKAAKKFPLTLWFYYCTSDTFVFPSRLVSRLIVNFIHTDPLVISFPVVNVDTMQPYIIKESGVAISMAGMALLHDCLSSYLIFDVIEEHYGLTIFPKILSRCPRLNWQPLPGLHPYSQHTILTKALDRSLYTNPVYNTTKPVDNFQWETIGRVPIAYGQTTREDFTIMFNHASGNLTVPKIMHHIWIGGRKIKDSNQRAVDTCREMYEKQGWTYIMWNEQKVKEEKILGSSLFDLYASTIGEYETILRVSDVVRLGLMYKYGGFYTDVDAVCLRPVDRVIEMMHNKNDLALCIESERARGGLLANGIILATQASQSIAAAIIHYSITNERPCAGVPTQAWVCSGPILMTALNRFWKSWLRLRVMPSASFLPVHFDDGMGIGGRNITEYAAYKGSFTVQLFSSL
jgi:mannosyltransferase OCH1-like enzyme